MDNPIRIEHSKTIKDVTYRDSVVAELDYGICLVYDRYEDDGGKVGLLSIFFSDSSANLRLTLNTTPQKLQEILKDFVKVVE